MGTKVEKQIEEIKFKQAILDMILELEKRGEVFVDLHRRTRCDIYERIVEWISSKIKELGELL
jgi:predicted transcriptional regulator